MTDLQHLQRVLLEIAQDIDRICVKNGIKYYLLGGSCIGAIRHKGFIPWDDDLDICIPRSDYDRFIEVCKKELDSNRYVLQEGLKDWPLNFSKIRLKGTVFREPEDDYASEEMRGIFVDIFCLENVPDNNFLARIQYFLAKYYLCYQLGERKYHHASIKKKCMMFLAFPLKIKSLRKKVISFIEKFNSQPTQRWGFFYGRTKYKSAIVSKSIYGIPKYVDFENIKLPVPEKYHEYLTQIFGDYMKLPPVEQRKGLHLVSIDFGNY